MASRSEQLKHRVPRMQVAANKVTSDIQNKKLEQRFSRDEISKHVKPGDMWIIHNNYVFNIPEKWLVKHPGGYDAIATLAGGDATDAFEVASNIGHSEYARGQIAKLVIGIVEGEDPSEEPGESPSDRSGGSSGFLSPQILVLLLFVLVVAAKLLL